MTTTLEVSNEKVWDERKGKEVGPYVAVIVGPGTRFALERSFLRWSTIHKQAGQITLPHNKEAVYEVRDFVDGSKRVRYFQVHDAAVRPIETATDEDVLDAVDAAMSAVWWEGATNGTEDGAIASTLDVLEALDRCIASIENGDDYDKEDVLMELDKVRRVVERL